jgi:hypothetical protein
VTVNSDVSRRAAYRAQFNVNPSVDLKVSNGKRRVWMKECGSKVI